jgi:hypothetical protein
MRRRGLARVGPWLTVVLITAEVCLVWSGLVSLRAAIVAGIAIDALLWATVIGRVVVGLRRFRSSRAAGAGGWQAGEDALTVLVPRRLARLILLEPRLWVCLARWATGRHDGRSERSYTYHRNFRPLLVGVIGLVVLEGAVVDTVLALAMPGSVWVWVAGGVHLYALGWLAGLWASFATRPHLLGDDALYVRDGVFTELVVPYTAIHGARLVRGSNLGRSGFKIDPELKAATLALGDTTVVVDVDPAAQLLVNGNRLPGPVVTLAITVDRSHDFIQTLSRLRSANNDGSPTTPGAATLPAGWSRSAASHPSLACPQRDRHTQRAGRGGVIVGSSAAWWHTGASD